MSQSVLASELSSIGNMPRAIGCCPPTVASGAALGAKFGEMTLRSFSFALFRLSSRHAKVSLIVERRVLGCHFCEWPMGQRDAVGMALTLGYSRFRFVFSHGLQSLGGNTHAEIRDLTETLSGNPYGCGSRNRVQHGTLSGNKGQNLRFAPAV